MGNKIIDSIDSLNVRLKRRRERLARYIELKRLSRIRNFSVPKYTHCKNCGEKLLGMYCHKCGQYALDVNQSFWKYIHNFLENAYQLDGRVFQTMRFLFTRPGFLSKEYVLGRVNSYVHPLKLYMFVSILFFSFALAKYSSSNFSEKVAAAVVMTGGDDTPKESRSEIKDPVTELQPDNNEAPEQNTNRKEETKVKIKQFYNSVYNSLIKYVPFLILLLMPVYAYILYLSHRKHGRFYLHSFVFSIHVHTLCLILFALVALLSPYLAGWMFAVIFALFVVYNIVAVRVFYGRKWWVSILKTVWDMSVYAFILFVCLSVVTLLVVVSIADDMGIL